MTTKRNQTLVQVFESEMSRAAEKLNLIARERGLICAMCRFHRARVEGGRILLDCVQHGTTVEFTSPGAWADGMGRHLTWGDIM
jgi:hypothetical protein